MGSTNLHPKRHQSSYEDLVTPDPIPADDPVPPFLANGDPIADTHFGLLHGTVPESSVIAFTRAFEAFGRTFLLATDQTVVPADRVRAYARSSFHGVVLGDDVNLPLAWMRGSPKPKFVRMDDDVRPLAALPWPVRSFVGLTGASVTLGTTRYLETRETNDGHPVFIAERDATVVSEAANLPAGLKPAQKWIAVSISQGTLVAYEGSRAVYTTLVSPGRGGIPTPGRDLVEASTTPLGRFTITFKDKAATMSPDFPDLPLHHWIADVPFTQYFRPPFALHGAFWHERFGEPASGGCINLAPIDAEALFAWSDPQVPTEWQGATGAGAPENGPATIVVVRR